MKGKDKITGIRGWLILPAIGIISALILNIKSIVRILYSLNIDLIKQYFGQYLLIRKIALFELIFFFVILVFFVQVGWLFFRKKSFLPKAFIALIWINSSFSLVDFIWALNIFEPSDALEFIRLFRSTGIITAPIAAIVWTLYFRKSQRVKNTFVNKIRRSDILFSVITLSLIFISAFLSLSYKKDAIKELFAERKRPAIVYSYPLLKLKLADDSSERLSQALRGQIPEGYELSDNNNEKILVKKDVIMELDSYLKNVSLGKDWMGSPCVNIALDQKGAGLFLKVTQENIDRRLAILFNGKIISAPVIKEEIPGGMLVISGNFSFEETDEIISSLKFVIKNKQRK